MRKLHIIMPMGGEGSRFKDVGIDTPKPLIEAHKIPFFLRALNSIVQYVHPDYVKTTFIVRQNHINDYQIDTQLKQYVPDANIAIVEQTTRGAVETCLMAEHFIDEDDAILILDCDLEFSGLKFGNFVQSIVRLNNDIEHIDGLLLTFQSNTDKYSYVKTDEKNYALETAEKKPISSNAIIGAYFFSYADDFLEAAHRLIEKNDLQSTKEFYTSLLYNDLIKQNKKILVIPADTYSSFGTPEELQKYESRYNRF